MLRASLVFPAPISLQDRRHLHPIDQTTLNVHFSKPPGFTPSLCDHSISCYALSTTFHQRLPNPITRFARSPHLAASHFVLRSVAVSVFPGRAIGNAFPFTVDSSHHSSASSFRRSSDDSLFPSVPLCSARLPHSVHVSYLVCKTPRGLPV